MYIYHDNKFESDYLTPFNLSTDVINSVRMKLIQETNANVLRNVELSEITGWPTSKGSKIQTGKQGLTDDDIRVWSRALGYKPDAFLKNNYDLRSYNVRDHVHKLDKCLEIYLNTEDAVREAIAKFEMPLAILSSLGLKISDYAVRAHASGIRTNSRSDVRTQRPMSVRIWHRSTGGKDKIVPELYFFVDPRDRMFGVIIYVNRHGNVVRSGYRQKLKDLMEIDEYETNDYDAFAIENKSWLSMEVSQMEITHRISTTDVLPDEKYMNKIVGDMFEKYCKLVWQEKGMDLLPEHFKKYSNNTLSLVEEYSMIANEASFDIDVVKSVLLKNDYKCEIDATHTSFQTEDGTQYMEVVPLIPFQQAVAFGKVALGDANAVCLCPNCRMKMLHGKRETREKMIMNLYVKHRLCMENAGINFALSDVLRVNGL